MLGRWRSQQNAKHLEEERLNSERERSSSEVTSPPSDAASPTDAASPRTSEPAPPSSATSPRSPEGSLHSVHTPEPPSTPTFPASDQLTPVSLDASTPAEPGTPTGPATTASSYYSPSAQAHKALDPVPDPDTVPDSDPVPDPDTVPDSDLVRDATKDANTPLAAKDGVFPDSTAPGDGARGTPASAKKEVKDLGEKPHEDLPVAEKGVTSSENDPPKTAEGVPISSNSENCQKDAKLEISSDEDPLKKAASKMSSDDLERSNTVGDSAGEEYEQKSEGASNITEEKPTDVIETTNGRGKILPHSKSSNDGKKSLEADRNESSDSNSSHKVQQSCEAGKPDVIHRKFGRKTQMKYYVAPPPRPLKGAPHDQIIETYSPSGSFETVNYLSQSSFGICAQRTFGAAKANRVTGCAVSLMEKGVSLITAPVVPLFRCWQTPLMYVDRMVYQGVSGVASLFSCGPGADTTCCSLRGCDCKNEIIYIGEEFEIESKLKKE